jgi:hypothetical protein
LGAVLIHQRVFSYLGSFLAVTEGFDARLEGVVLADMAGDAAHEYQ